MSRSTLLRRAGATFVASAVTISLVAAGGAAQAAPADRGADWLSGQLTDGLVVGTFDGTPYNDYGLSIDTAFALQAIGGHGSDVRDIRNAMSAHVGDYIEFGKQKYAAATAKLLVLAENTGADPRNFGGMNLVKRLNSLVIRSGPAEGRIADRPHSLGFANTIGQILAVRGLTEAQSGLAGKARRFLLEQQCRQGYFRLSFSRLSSHHQTCGKKSPADPDVTSYAVIQLWKTSKGNAKLRGALRHAASWLATQQRKSGAFIGGTTTSTPNTNSTGLAAWALAKDGKCSSAKAAATWVADFQVGKASGSKLAGQRGAIAYDRAAFRAGKRHGITDTTQDQWRRSTAQAAPALQYLHGC
jgi:hypothetical protein